MRERSRGPHKNGPTAGGLIAIVVALCAVLVLPRVPLGRTANAHAAPERFNEYAVKAAFLFNFAKFIEWPDGSFEYPRSPLSLCVLGNDLSKKNIDFLDSNTIKGRQLLVRHLAGDENFHQCKIIFVSKSEEGRVPQILSAVRNANILTVGEVKNFCRAGGVINLFLENNMVRFEVNVDAAERAGLTISSELLKLARIVREDR